eukprot:2329836-Pleurochrysis_carterae.AAC.1
MPTFSFATAPAAAPATGPATHSTPASAAPTSAAPATQPSTVASSTGSIRNFTADERDHLVISPEQLASVDRQMMESILSTITSPATRPGYRVQ